MAKNSQLKVRITGDAKDLKRATDKAQGHLRSISGSAAKLAGVMASAFAVRELASFGNDLYRSGLNLEAWRVKAETVFEDSLSSVRKWADGQHVALGVTDEALVNLAASTADLLKPMGMTAEEAANMSMEVTELSGALAAWTGGTYDAAEVSGILSKAMLGEREQLKMLGISINQAEVDQRALTVAMEDGRSEITQMDKALATNQLIQEKSVDAQTAWAEGLEEQAIRANQLKVAFNELKERIASALIPVFATLFEMINLHVVPAVSILGDWLAIAKDVTVEFVRDGLSKINEWWDSFGSPVFEDIKDRIGRVNDALIPVRDSAVALVERGLARVSDWWSTYGTPAMDELRGAVDDLKEKIDPAKEAVVGFVDDALTGLSSWWSSFGEPTLRNFREGLKDLADKGLKKVTDWWKSDGKVVLDKLASAFDTVWEAISPVREAISDLVDNALDKLSEWFTVEGAAVTDFSEAFDALAEKAVLLKNAVVDFVENGLNRVSTWVDENTGKLVFLGGVLGTLLAAFVGFKIVAGITAALAALAAVIAAVSLPVLLTVGAVALLVGALAYLYYRFETVRDITHMVLHGLWATVQFVFDSVIAYVGALVGVFQGFIDVFRGIFSGDVGMIMDGMRQIVDAAFGFVKEEAGIFLSFLKDIWKLSFLSDAWDAAVELIKSAATGVKNWVVEKFQEMIDFFGGIGDAISSAASGAFDGLANSAIGAINAIIGAWNALEFEVPGFKIGPVGYDGFSVGTPNIPEIPTFASAEGGVFNSPTLTWVGENGPEAVVPWKGLPAGNTAPGASPLPAMGGGDVNVYVETDADPSEIGASVAWALATGGVA